MSTTIHPFAPEEIMALLDGELSAGRAQAVSAHFVDCPECNSLAKKLGATRREMCSWEIDTLPTVIQDRVHAAIAAMPSPTGTPGSSLTQRASFWTWKQWLAGLSATAVVGLLFLAITMPSLKRSPMAAKEASRIARAPSVDSASVNSPNARGLDEFLSQPDDVHLYAPRSAQPSSLPIGRRQFSEPRPAAPMIARSVALSLVVKDFDAGRASLDAILARHNGYAAGLNVAAPKGAARTLQASLRIPAPQLAAALAELKALGRLEAETQNGEEVTQQHADLVARLKNSHETERRLQDVLRTRTGRVKDVLEVEQEIARVRGEIEQMEGEQKTLEHRVDFATIDLRVAEEYKAQLTSPAPSVGMQLRNAAVNGFRTVSESLLAVVLLLAETGPSLLLWFVILFFPARLLWRRYRRAQALGSPLGV
jgi:anti-sigma factor RsiW